MNRVVHPIKPLYDSNSSILILGSFPSVKSREEGFFYGHPQNRFWKVMAALFDDELPQNIMQKSDLLHRNHVALWDVIASCEIKGSSDASIRDVVPNDLSVILEHAAIRKIFVTGKTAEKLYNKYIFPDTGIKITTLPSTSPANAAWSVDRLIEEWRSSVLPFVILD